MSAKTTKAASKRAERSATIVAAGAELLARVAAIDWDAVSGGQAKGFPEAFLALGAGDKKSDKGLAKVKKLLGEGQDTRPIAGLAMPFLVELVAARVSCDLAALLCYLADASVFGHARWLDHEPSVRTAFLAERRACARTHAAFCAGAEHYAGLLSHEAASVRAAAAFALAWVVESPATTLLGALPNEADGAVRESMLLALSQWTKEPGVADALRARLDAGVPASERVCAAIACSFGVADAQMTPALIVPVVSNAASPWCGGDLRSVALRRALVLVFGLPPGRPPAEPPTMSDAQREILRAMLGETTPLEVTRFAERIGLPKSDASLRRFAGLPRAIPAGKHEPIFEQWMSWVESGTTSAARCCEQMLAKIAPADVVDVLELMSQAEAAALRELAAWGVPELPAVPPPAGADDYQQPGSVYRYHVGSVDACVSAYAAMLRGEGWTVWAHGRDCPADLNQGDVVAWHVNGREIRACFDTHDDLVRARYEWNSTLLRAFAAAAVARDGPEQLLEGLRRVAARSGLEVWRAIAMLRVSWTVADVGSAPPDPACDDLAFVSGARRHYIYWTARAHLERLSGARRTALVVRLLAADTDGVVGWVQFAPGPETAREAEKLVARRYTSTSTSWNSLEAAEHEAEKIAPFVDAALRQRFAQQITSDDNPVVQVLVLGRFGERDPVRPALESEYPLAREAAKKVLG
jgi:hypothetical protein